MLTFATVKASTGTSGQRRMQLPLLSVHFDLAVIELNGFDLLVGTLEARVRPMPWGKSGHMTTQSMSQHRQGSTILIFAIKKLLIGTKRQRGCSFPFSLSNIDQAAVAAQWHDLLLVT